MNLGVAGSSPAGGSWLFFLSSFSGLFMSPSYETVVGTDVAARTSTRSVLFLQGAWLYHGAYI